MSKNFLITLGTGPAEPILRRGKNRRLQTSTFIYLVKTALLFDTGPAFLKQIRLVEKALPRLPSRINIFFSHLHGDATFGAKDAFDYFQRKKISTAWHGHAKTLAAIKIQTKSAFASIAKAPFVKLKDKRPVRVGDILITPFLVRHVITRGRAVPTFGYQLKSGRTKIVMATDVYQIPSAAQKYFKNADFCLIDAAGWGRSIINHHDVLKFLEQSRNWGIKKILLTQVGRLVPPHNEANRYLAQYFSNASLAYDGMKIKF